MRKPVVLVVDDEGTVRELAAALLSLDGYEVVDFAHAEAALAWTGTHTADVIVLDLRMWPMDGVTFIERMIEVWGAMPPTVIVSAYVVEGRTAEVTAKAQALVPINRVISKPFDITDLEAALAEVLAAAGEREGR
jgi:CheY-like chemotaxis protein